MISLEKCPGLLIAQDPTHATLQEVIAPVHAPERPAPRSAGHPKSVEANDEESFETTHTPESLSRDFACHFALKDI